MNFAVKPDAIKQDVEGSLVIYDPSTAKATLLSSEAQEAWTRLESEQEIPDSHLGLAQLLKAGLVMPADQSVDRRQVLKKLAGAVAAVPALMSVAAPSPAMATSLSCLTCPAGTFSCFECFLDFGTCSGCGQDAPDDCPTSAGRCRCLTVKEINVTSCATDFSNDPLCLDVVATGDARVQSDCAAARLAAEAAVTPYDIVLCEGSIRASLANEYACCFNCL